MDDQAQPLTCSLEDADLVARLAAWHEVLRRATSRRVDGGRVVATYPRDAELLRRLCELIAAEAACCSFLHFGLDETPDSIVTELRLPQDLPDALRAQICEVFGG